MNERLVNKYGRVVKVALVVSRRNDHSNVKSVVGVVDRSWVLGMPIVTDSRRQLQRPVLDEGVDVACRN